MTERNVNQIADWNGRTGERWVANQARLDRMLGAYGREATAAAAPVAGEHVLDIGCGAGAGSLEIAALVGPSGAVLGVDVSEPLVERARELAAETANARFQVADASRALLPVEAFDLLFSRFGVMFFDEPAAAFAHLRRALKPGGRLAFVCWRGAGENDWVRLPMKAIAPLVGTPAPPPPEAPGPFSFGDRARVERILGEAGFVDVVLTPVDHPITFGEGETREAAIEDAVDLAFQVGPLTRALADQADAVRQQAIPLVREAFATKATGEAVVIEGAGWVVTARNPG
ncbi:SAM-dependent methyltransferase [Caulobacter flavus]|uniref:SAM-dependent methyltransferase n=1 Tax=Caulobacter flavus TaxID=1679497 RepID=A0A2N5CZN1_9CAUL|nr:class I SAM-dependent methyltransferase [Caulobacter flavus]AYV45051.1 SAM-dependent methyltransferase [Caulobacter flavus]PLR19267.1 SAM-dependent methyltransferase [Caulobacter flavus]